jgi:membrane fusion protein (multidrug efflux system)
MSSYRTVFAFAHQPRPALLAVLPLAALLAACGAKDAGPGAGGSTAGGPPPASVGVVTVANEMVALQTELPGRVSALRVAQVRARVNGVVLKRLFREGSEVKAGQALYQIDAGPYRAALESALASVAKGQANLAQATAQVERYKPLVEANAISKQEYFALLTTQKQAEADVATAKAAAQTAQINLDYASVNAPISGRIGQSLVTEGALVSAAEATQLAVIQQTDTVYINFTQSTTDVLRLRKAIAAKQVRSAGDGSVPVRVVLEDGSELPRPGKLLFTDLTVDATSGQITLTGRSTQPRWHAFARPVCAGAPVAGRDSFRYFAAAAGGYPHQPRGYRVGGRSRQQAHAAPSKDWQRAGQPVGGARWA